MEGSSSEFANRFNSLPPELREKIISNNPELILPFYQANIEYNRLMANNVYKQICEKEETLTGEEIHNAQSQQMLYTMLSIQPTTVGASIFALEMVVKAASVEFNIPLVVIRVTSTNTQFINLPDNFIRDPESFDILTIYNITSNRLNCMRINPNYAKISVREEVQTELIEFNKSINRRSPTDPSFNFNLVGIYLRLLMNIYVLNIPLIINIQALEDIPNNLNIIIQDIINMHNVLMDMIDKIWPL